MAAKAKRRTGFDASYLEGESEVKDTDIFGDMPDHALALKTQVDAVTDASSYPHIALELLHDNPYQPRKKMSQERLEILAREIRLHGFRGVVLARRDPNDTHAYQLVYGHRRRDAARIAGLTTIPVYVQNIPETEMMFLAANENLLRDDLTPVEEGHMYQMMLQSGCTQEEVAERMHKSRGYIRGRLEIIKAPDDVQAMVETKPATVRAAHYLRDVQDEQIRTTVIYALLQEEITGENVPRYIANLQQEKERQQQTATVQMVFQDHITTPEKPAPSDTASSQPRTEKTTGEVALTVISTSIKRERHAPDVLEQSKQESTSLREQSKLKTILKQLTSYQDRCGLREEPLTKDEQNILKEIIAVVQGILHG